MKFLYLIVLFFSLNANAFELTGINNTQFNGSSCQSYSFAILLTLKDKKYGETAKQLTNTEREIRSLILKHAAGKRVTHEHWAKAISEHTKGKYKLNLEYVKEYTKWVQRVRELTTVNLQDILTNPMIFQKAVATSISKIDNSKYSSGHVITILQVDEALIGDNKIVYLNGGIKPSTDTIFSDHICQENSYGSNKYLVGIRQTKDYELRGFPNFGIYWID